MKLNLYCAAQSRTKISQFKTILQSIYKGRFSITEYVLKVKNVVDRLASIGHIISNSDHVEAMFDGLSRNNDTFIISVNSRLEPYTVEETESLLLAQEAMIVRHSKELDASFINIATHRKHHRGGNANTEAILYPSIQSQHNYNRGNT